MSKKILMPSTALSPVPVVMVSCGDEEHSNITTIAWTGVINSEPPMVYISMRPSRYSYDIIKNTGEFVINIPDESLVSIVDYCGIKSGREEDKFKKAHLQKEKCSIVKAPAIYECPIHLECKVKEVKKLGTHDMFIAEIVAVGAKEEILEDNKINYAKANIITYLGSQYYVANRKIGEKGIGLTLNK